jgi:uncharacterized glyoxalase superfamily metalloenzyme YdcJ
MKLHSLSVQLAAGVALAFLSFGVSSGHAASAAPIQIAGESFAQPSPFRQITWEQYKIDKLEHAYHLLEHAKEDYDGHREKAVHAVKKAAEVLGVEFHGADHPDESQWKSDKRLREAKHLLEDLIVEGKGTEQPHIHRAIKEIDKALALQ